MITDREELQTQETNDKVDHKNFLDSLREIMSTYAFQKFCALIIDHSGFFKTSFNSDIAIMSFSEGRRDVGNYMLSILQEADQTYLNYDKFTN